MLSAWDPATQTEKWTAPVGGPSGGGVLSTAGNLVIQVTGAARLYAYTADKGQKLLEIPLGQSPAGPPITYMVDNKQHCRDVGSRLARRAAFRAAARGCPASSSERNTGGETPSVCVYARRKGAESDTTTGCSGESTGSAEMNRELVPGLSDAGFLFGLRGDERPCHAEKALERIRMDA